jgi:carboxypeptidase C (cathepsin A)
MNRLFSCLALSSLLLSSAVFAKEEAASGYFQPEQSETQGLVNGVDYQAVAGTLVVHAKGWQDTAALEKSKAGKDDEAVPAPEASMFYAAYFKKGAKAESRPITFLFNGGPGSSTIWLHMGAFGPKRVVTPGDQHQPAAPYKLVDNQYSLLDASDLVFIDAPGTGFSRIAGKDKEKAFFGVDEDAHAFAEFVTQFLSKYGRWNSPKYIFGESYGTTRAAALVNLLENQDAVDVNGVILVSQALNYDVLPDYPEQNPGIDEPYVMWLPSYATTAWYHKKLPDDAPKDLKTLVAEVEAFAAGDYTSALAAGNRLDPAQRKAVAAALHKYTGLPVAYIEKANLRVTMGEFQKTLLGEADMTTGGLDTRFSGPTIDPLSKEASYDPQGAAIGSAYVAAGNTYLRNVLKFGGDHIYQPEIHAEWNFSHQPPGAAKPIDAQVNVMPDLAAAMKMNPTLKIMANAGYFDVVTPFYEGIYEMSHLAIPPALQSNIEFAYYESGHMVYVNEASLRALHDNVAAFIHKTAHVGS